MADKLIFPIGFDLEKGIQEAQGDADRLLRRLEMQIKSRPLAVNLKINGAGDGSINSINSRIKELVERWNSLTEAERVASKTSGEYTAEAKKILAEYTRLVGASESYARTLQQISSAARRSTNEQEKMAAKQRASWEKLRKAISANENTIDGLNAKIKAYQQRLNGLEVGSKKFDKTAEKIQHLSIKLDEAKKKVAELTGKMATSAPKQAQAVKLVNQELQNQDGYVSRLLKRMAVYAGYSMIGTFLTNVREVTAQFELQRISLGAIIQDQSRANQLFSEIKTFALKSPIKILDLAKYTKQVAAYGVETDKLFDTTKRIMDISVGLGVDASRLVLAFGQVKAASYLRAAEIRQFTEAGIPMLELLAEKFTELNGKAVTTEQVMDMVSKRMVGFNMVEEIFKDMTSAGGMFFDMQEKQGNTLYGMWAKLGDAASVMYEQIGNTSSVNSAMKDLIQLLTDLMKNWRLVGREMVVVVGTLALLRANTVLSTRNTQAAEVATNQYAVAQTRLNAAQKAGSKISANAAKYSAKAAVANRAAAMSTNAWTAAQFKLIAATNSLKAAFLGNWITLTIAAIAAIGAAIYSAYEKAHKLQNELKEIETTGAAESAKSVFNFERLANAALGAANGSKQQNDALEELKRTYKDIIPAEELSITNLRKMREEGYVPLTAAIKEYIAQRTLQKEIDAITENYTSDTIAKQRKVRELLKRGSVYNPFKGVAWSPIEALDDDQISQVFANVDKIAKDKSKSWQDVWIEAIKDVTDVSKEQEAKMRKLFSNAEQNINQTSYNNKLRDIVDNTRNMATETDAATKKMDEQTGSLGKYGKVLAATNKSLENLRLTYSNGNVVDSDTFLATQMNNNAHIKAWKDDIVEDLKDAGIDIKNEWFNIIQNLNATNPSQISSINFAPILDAIEAAKDKLGDKYIPLKNAIGKYQELYNGVVPSDRTVSAMRSRLMQIGNNVDKTGGIMNDLQRHLMQSGDSWENYSKNVRDAVANYETQIEEMRKINASIKNGERGFGPLDPSKYSDEEIKKVELLVEALKQLFPFLAPQKSQSSNGGRKSDPRLQNLKEEISLVQKLYNEYKQLEKQEGASKAAEDMERMAKASLDMLSKKYGISLPTTAKDLTSALEILYKKMAELPTKVFPALDKELNELRWTIEKVDIDDSQKNIEAQLKSLADRISRTKTAKDFYDKILSQTGDVELAAKLSVSVYGQDGGSLQREIASQLSNALKGVTADGQTIGPDVFEEGVIDPNTFYVNYAKLRKIVEKQGGKLSDSQKKILDDMLKNGEAYNKSQVEQWAKDLAKVKDFTDQYIDLYRMTEQRKAEIRAKMKSGELDEDAGKQAIAGYDARLVKEQSKIQYEMFKNSPMYTSLFENMEDATVQSLHNMRSQIEKMMAVTKEPTQLKELQNRLNEIDATLAEKSPFEVIAKGWQTMGEMAKKYGSRSNLDNLIKQKQAELDALQAELDAALEKEAQAQQFAEMSGVNIQNPATAITPVQKAALAAYQQASADVEKYDDAVKKADKEQQELTSDATKWANAMGKVKKGLKTFVQICSKLLEASEAAADFAEALGMSEDGLELFQDINNVISNTINFADALIGCVDLLAKTTATSIKTVESASVILTVISTALQVATAIFNVFSNSKVRKANKEIERQQELLDRLEYTYGRLEKAAEKAFGSDYINNFKQQQQNLQAQARAYQAQAAAERSKGKKADEDKIKEYENAYRDTMDEIADMQGKLAEQMAGTDVASAARDFAQAWLEAYASFSNTSDALKEKFNDLIKNMVIESVMARMVQMTLQPLFDQMDEMYRSGKSMTTVLMYAMERSATLAEQLNNGLLTSARQLESAGIDLRGLYDSGSELTGISRDIATASEESINGLAAHMNTVEYYVAQIHQNVATIAANKWYDSPLQQSIDYSALMQQSIDRLSMIERYSSEILVECRRNAVAAESALREIQRVIVPRDVSRGTHYVSVRLG